MKWLDSRKLTNKTQGSTSNCYAKKSKNTSSNTKKRATAHSLEKSANAYRRMVVFGTMLRTTALLMILTATANAEPLKASLQPEMVNRIVDAIYRAEGGAKTKYPYGIKSVRCTTPSTCRKICENTVRNNYKRWLKTDRSMPFLYFLADRYCPPSVDLDGNKNWKRNVPKLAGVML